MVRHVGNILIFLALTAEMEGFVFAGLWSTPLTSLGNFLFRGLPLIKIPAWDLALFITVLVAARSMGKHRVKAVNQAIRLALAGVAIAAVWGLLRGGSSYQMIFQVRCYVLHLFVALFIAGTCRTSAHVESLGKVVVFSGLYRACVLLVFYFAVAKDLPEKLPALTDHCDSVLFVGALFVLLVNALERRTASAVCWAVFGTVLLVIAIALNNRRLAWLLIGVGLIVMYLLLPKGRLKRRINLVLMGLAPILVAYLVAGWGRPEGIFKPVGSISTMFGTHQDVSSVMRDIENYNLVQTLKSNPLLGLGLGREYIEEVVAFDISSIFPQYRYLPHNSLLGVIAFTGIIGFSLMWQLVLVTAYLHVRTYQSTRQPVPRIAALSSLVGLVLIELQMWGDIGFNHIMVTTLMAIPVGLAARVPVMAGAWPGAVRSKARQNVQNG